MLAAALMLDDTMQLGALLFFAALLYTSVGHGGGSGYLAAMTLVGVAQPQMRATALVLNIVASAIATFRYASAGWFRGRLFWPFVATSIPFAYFGGRIQLPSAAAELIIALTLLVAAWRLAMSAAKAESLEVRPLRLEVALIVGGAIGLVSGLVGVGGGIFLSPLLLFMRSGGAKEVAGVSAPFILVNSIAGLIGALSKTVDLRPDWATLVVIVFIGGWIGSELGSRRLAPVILRRLLAVVLVVAAAKSIISAFSPHESKGAKSPITTQESPPQR